MGTQKVIVSDPEGYVIVGSFIVVIAAADAVGVFERPVKSFDHLLKRPEFFGHGIVIGQSNDLGDVETESFSELEKELLGSQRIGSIAVGDEPELFGKFFEMAERHSHGKDAGTNAAVVRDLVAKNRARGGIDDEPQVAFDATDFYVSFVSDHGVRSFVVIVVYEWFDDQSGSSGIVGDLLV